MYKHLLRFLLFLVLLILLACTSDDENRKSALGSCSVTSVSVLSPGVVEPFGSGVPTNRQISVEFNNCLDVGSINSNSFYVTGSDASVKVNGQIKYNTNPTINAPTVLIFQPTTPFLPANDTITVTVTKNVTGFSGEPMFFDFKSTFSTGSSADTNKPITTATLAAGFYNTSQNVDLVCDDKLDESGDTVVNTGCDQTYYTIDDSIPSVTSTRYTGASIVIGDAAPDEQITTINLRYFSTDFAGNAEAVVTQVYIIDKVKPNVLSVSLEDAIDVPVDSVVSAVFDEDMLESSFMASNIVFDSGVIASYSFDSANQTLTMTPIERLACNTLHTVTLESGLSDLAGNNLAATKSWSFTTTPDCAEPVTLPDLAGGVYKAVQNVTLSCTDAASGCSKLVYTTDGSVPSFSLLNGTVINASIAGPIEMGIGDTLLRYYSVDVAGNREVLREQLYSISTTGFTYVSTQNGLARGVGSEPLSYINTNSAGPTKALFVDVSNNRFYRGTTKGLYYSDNDGAIWRQLGVSVQVNAIFALGSKIIVGTLDGLKTSLDGGATFPREEFGKEYIYDVIVLGSDVFVAQGNGLSISNHKGVNFSTRTVANGLGSNFIYDIDIDGTEIYAATSMGLYRSVGLEGNAFNNVDTQNSFIADDTVYAVQVDGTSIYAGTKSGLFKADKTANSEFVLAQDLANSSVNSLLVAGNKIYVGLGDNCCTAPDPAFAVSINGGESFIKKRVAPTSSSQDAAVTSFVVNAGTLYVGAFPGYYTSVDDGASFSMGAIPFDNFTSVVGDGSRVYAAASNGNGYGGVFTSNDGGQTFSFSTTEQGLGAPVNEGLFVDGSRLYATSSSPVGGLAVSTDYGLNFSRFTQQTNGLFVDSVSAVYASGETIYAAAGLSLDISTSYGDTFSPLFRSDNSPVDIDVFGSTLYLATTGGIYVSNDIETMLRTTTDGLAENATRSVTVNSSGRVFVGTLNNGISMSDNNGTSFSSVQSLSSGGVYALHEFASVLYAGTSNGIATSSDAGDSFTVKTTADGLGSNIVSDVYYAAPQKLVPEF